MGLEEFSTTKNRFELIVKEEAAIIDGINDSLMWGAMDYLRSSGFKWVEVPILTKITGACENVDTLYAVDHFGQEAYLAQTGQLYLEAKIPLHKKLWTIITSSRAEDKADDRHLNQFQLIELEHEGTLDGVDSAWSKHIQNTPMISKYGKKNGLPLFFYEFKKRLMEAHPDATDQDIYDTWVAQEKKGKEGK